MRLGHGHARSVVILWLWSGLLSAFVLYPVYTGKGNAVVPIGVLAAGLLLLTFFHPGSRRARAAEVEELGAAVAAESAAATLEAGSATVGDDGVRVPADRADDADERST
jgi:UDP-GlcNAc:undecaprenyl-phosphate GlcNAc-1-phosphate transferase